VIVKIEKSNFGAKKKLQQPCGLGSTFETEKETMRERETWRRGRILS